MPVRPTKHMLLACSFQSPTEEGGINIRLSLDKIKLNLLVKIKLIIILTFNLLLPRYSPSIFFMALQTLAMSQYCRNAYCGAPFTFLMSISFRDNENSKHGHLKLCSMVTIAYGTIHLKTLAYHYFSKALEDVKQVMVSGGLLQVSNE